MSADPPSYTVAVRALAEFTARQGDLDVRFAPSPTAREGIEGHALVAARRGAPYQSEVALSGEYGCLRVRGRADGYDPVANRLEEIKTHRGRLDRQPDDLRRLHWAQAMLYGWLMCEARALPAIELALVYLDVASQRETVFVQAFDADTLREHFERRCQAFVAWSDQELAHRARRDAALATLAFPHESFRAGQRALAAAVYRAARDGQCLLAQAPTGIGKTIGTLFAQLRAMPGQRLDKLFFLTAKTSGRAMAQDALGVLAAGRTQATQAASGVLPGPDGRPALRALELVARDKACEHPDAACHGESCPLARGFHDRLPAAREAALAEAAWDRQAVRRVALTHSVCPYYLGQELARWADVVVGDYNHYFDTHALLHALAVAESWRVGVLVDEAHNLVERARGMYSATLAEASLTQVRRAAPASLRRPLARLGRCWKSLGKELQGDYRTLDAVPAGFATALQQAMTAIMEHLLEHADSGDGALLAFHFELLRFARLAESFGEHSLLDAARAPSGSLALSVRCVVPAPFLAPRFGATHTVTLFSATLQPQRFYRDLLGLPPEARWVEVDTPFHADQLAVKVAAGVSTRLARRGASIDPIVALIAHQFADRPGNYLAFFSSYDYLDEVAAAFEARHPGIACWRQARRMSEPEQAQFLARFVAGAQGVGFAVLGGSFAEGIDLPGERLVGAFIATLGLPAANEVNEQMRARIDRLLGAGFDYTYLYPGLQKVVQAAGRVIRSPTDRGVVHLIDDRFARREVRRLLPGWWRIEAA